MSERADTSEVRLALKMPEAPGAFQALYDNIFPCNVTEFTYRFYKADAPADIMIAFQPRTATRAAAKKPAFPFEARDVGSLERLGAADDPRGGGRERSTDSPAGTASARRTIPPAAAAPPRFHRRTIRVGRRKRRRPPRRYMDRLEKGGYSPRDVTNDQLVSTHLRHVAGGRSKRVGAERIFRFEFPEAPGALRKFLSHFGPGFFNCSLFHYRNYGRGPGGNRTSRCLRECLCALLA